MRQPRHPTSRTRPTRPTRPPLLTPPTRPTSPTSLTRPNTGRLRQHLIRPQSFVCAHQPPHVLGHLMQRRGLALHHVAIELGRTPHRLAGVVDDEVEARAGGQQLAAERLNARRVAQIEAEDLETIGPVREVRLARVTLRRIAREPGRDDQARTAAQQLQARLVANLDAPARQQRDAAAQVRDLRPLAKVELGALGTELIVEVVDDLVLLLADVTVLRI